MSYTKNQQAADIAAVCMRLHYEDCDKIASDLDNSSNFYAKMGVINKLCQDYENNFFSSIMATMYKATPKQVKHARLRMLYTLLPKLSEIDMINLKTTYGMRKGQKIIDDIENTFISNIYTLYPDIPKRETLMRVINNIHAKDMLFGVYLDHVGVFSDSSSAWIRTILSALNKEFFYHKMRGDCNHWNYSDGDLNLEVIELFLRRLMSFAI